MLDREHFSFHNQVGDVEIFILQLMEIAREREETGKEAERDITLAQEIVAHESARESDKFRDPAAKEREAK